MAFNPQTHHRKSIRLQGYDYSQAGLYFITLCVQNRLCLFGEISDAPDMILNDAGIMVEKWYFELPHKFPDIRCHEMVVMPNHFHCILENTGTHVGADLCVCPDLCVCACADGQTHRSAPTPVMQRENVILGNHAGSPLHRVVQWFKTMTTNDYIRGVKQLGWMPFEEKLWQRNYWEHIIRNQKAYCSIAEYIVNNPATWQEDQLFRYNQQNI